MVARKMVLLVVLTALGSAALGAASAQAATNLRVDPSGGTLLPSTTTLRYAASDPAILTTNLGTITCTQSSFDFDVTRNSSPTSISGTLTGLTFTSCTDTWPVVTIPDCSLHPASLPGISITATASGGTVALGDLTFRCAIQGGTSACYFTAASAVGTASNVARSLVFNNVGVVFASPTSDALGSGICGSTMSLSWQFTQLVQGGSNLPVTVTTS